MNSLRDYHYLVAVADSLHFGRAAELCHVSQPTLSGQLKKLESSVGFTIFERTNRKVTITRKGSVMIQSARQIIAAQRDFQQRAKELSSPFSGEIHLGLIPTLAPYLLPHIMPQLSSELKKMSFFLYEQQTEVLLQQLKEGKLDALILPWLPEMELFHHIDLFNESLILALSNGHPLIDKKSLTLADLKGYKVLTLQDGHCLRDQTLGYCFSAGAEEDSSFSATSLETLRYMVASGTGITLIPELAVQNREESNIVYRQFSSDQPYRKIVLLTRAAYGDLTSLQKIADIIRGHLNSH